MAAPRKKVKPKEYAEVCAMAAAGLTNAQIAVRLGMRQEAFETCLSNDADLRQHHAIGLAEEENVLRESLHSIATDSDNPRAVTAATFLLKSRHGYRDTDAARGPTVNVDNRSLNLTFPKPVRGKELEALVAEFQPASTNPERIQKQDDDLRRLKFLQNQPPAPRTFGDDS